MPRCRIRLVAFDVDGVLVPVRSSWAYLHERLGTHEASGTNYKLFMEGRIGYWEWMYLDTLAWIEARPGITRWELEELFDPVEPIPQAYEAVKLLREAGIEAALVSGGVDVLVSKVARLLRIRHWVSPALAFDPWGRLIPGGDPRLEADRKDRAVLRLARRLGLSMREVAFVGDSVWDLRGMREACLAVAVNTEDPRVIGEADYVAEDLLDAVYFILEHGVSWKG
ncbi:MAG: HAD-IB family phosphatase [Crenarchaeota archaeon]|nr:HAD-IB family phosphatase [Thermoproteota archaeon]